MEMINMPNELIIQLIELLLAILTGYVVQFIRTKIKELNIKTDNELIKKYNAMIAETIYNCVIATNQTYVETLKKQGKFDKEAQKIAFDNTYNAVLNILTEDTKKYIAETFGDLTVYLTQQIEAIVNKNKK